MKIRVGFVSNSSSTAFIVDSTADGAEAYLREARKELIGRLDHGRASCVANAEEMREYVKDEWDYCDDFILAGILDLGDNAVYVRISDEHMCGWYMNPPVNIIHSVEEWH